MRVCESILVSSKEKNVDDKELFNDKESIEKYCIYFLSYLLNTLR